MSTFQKITRSSPSAIKPLVSKIFHTKRSDSGTTATYARQVELKKVELGGEPAIRAILRSKSHWRSKEHREAYMEAAVEQGVAWQIKINRELRGWSQAQLAHILGTHQSAVSRLEDPDYGSHSLETLILVAKAFDCALTVKLTSYSDLAVESQRLSESDQYAAPFSVELESFSGEEERV